MNLSRTLYLLSRRTRDAEVVTGRRGPQRLVKRVVRRKVARTAVARGSVRSSGGSWMLCTYRPSPEPQEKPLAQPVGQARGFLMCGPDVLGTGLRCSDRVAPNGSSDSSATSPMCGSSVASYA